MFGSEILDAAIGMVLVFLLLSLVCSSAREALESVLQNRAGFLEKGLREIFNDRERKDLVPQFYKHPLINALFPGAYEQNSTQNLPAYIPPKTFAITVLDMVKSAAPKDTEAAEKAAGTIQVAVSTVAELNAALALPQNAAIAGALRPLIASAGNDMARVRKNIEDWYNASMDRVSGWYKRRTQYIIAAIGFAIAFGMNVDSIAITRYLSTNQTARELMVAQAKQTSGGGTTNAAEILASLKSQGGLPLGWSSFPQTPNDIILKLAGLLFTGFAISLGAPFWFDILNRFMVIRSTVKPEEKSPVEGSKDERPSPTVVTSTGQQAGPSS